MATLKPELKTILDRYGIDPRDTKQVWDCRGTLVLYHKAYEIIAAKEAITFDPPQVIRSDKTEAVVLVIGRMGDRSEWSFGEAVIGQNYQVSGKQAAYPWAMAEKRAKDRVIAKLVGLAQYVYSEDEAEEFKTAPRQPVEDEAKRPSQQQRQAGGAGEPDLIPVSPSADGSSADWQAWAQKLEQAIRSSRTVADVNLWLKLNKVPLKNFESAEPDAHKMLVDVITKYRAGLASAPAQEAA